MKIVEISVRRPVLTVMLILVFVIIGLYSYRRLTIDLFPKVDLPMITITTKYPGAGPSEVESQVTEKIEDELSTVSNVKTIDSVSMESVSVIYVEFELGVDIDIMSIEVKDKVDAILSDLPDEVEPPSIVKFDINALPVMNLSVSGPDSLDNIYNFADNELRDRLNRIDGMASVEIVGGLIREIQVNVSTEALNRYGLTITDLVELIGAENKDVPLGKLTSGDEEYTLRVMGQFDSVEDLAEATFALPSNAVVRLSDFAVVTDGFAEREDSATFQGQPSVGVILNKRSDANTVKVAVEVFDVIDEMRPLLPPGYDIGIAMDLSEFITKSVRDVLINILLGIIITSLFLYVFLHDIRSTLIASLAMPTSIISTFILMFFADFTINVITLMALGISIGILATNSIIVLENISRYIDEGHPPEEAAVKGTSEIAIAVIASTMTNIMVFTPIAYMSGIVGQFFRQFGLTVVFATIFSLLVSFTMAPMLATKFLKPSNDMDTPKQKEDRRFATFHRWRRSFFTQWDERFKKLSADYRTAVAWCLDHRSHTIITVIVIFFFSLFLLSLVGGEFTPASDEGYVSIQVTLPPGTPIEHTEGVLTDIEAIVLTHEEVETVFITVGEGNSGVNEGEMIIGLVDLSDRRLLTTEFINLIRPELAVIPEAEIAVYEKSQGRSAEAGMTILVTGPEMDTLTNLAEEVKSIVDTLPGLVDVDTSLKDPQPEIRFIPNRDIISNHGITTANIYSVLRASYEGEVASVYREGGEEYDILVRLSKEDRENRDLFENMLIQTPQGFAPLSQFGGVERTLGESEIQRKDRQKLIEVTANIGTGTLGQYESIINTEIDNIDIPEGYEVTFGGESERMAEAFQALFEALLMAIILTYVVLAAILESYIHPVTILVTVPLGLIGTAVGLFVSGMSINLFSLMAMVMLVGIVVNNAILILDYTNELREGGRVLRDALLEACQVKFRAIVMSTLAIAFAILPQALGGADAGFQVAMAVVTMGGVLFSAVFTLFLIPVVYEYMDRFTVQGRKERRGRTRRR